MSGDELATQVAVLHERVSVLVKFHDELPEKWRRDDEILKEKIKGLSDEVDGLKSDRKKFVIGILMAVATSVLQFAGII